MFSNKTLALAAETINHKNILRDTQPDMAEQAKTFQEQEAFSQQRLSYLG